MREYYDYIMTNGVRTLYIGVTNDLTRRAYEHKHKLIDGFTKNTTLHSLYTMRPPTM
jgi:putative endonuclease